MNKFEPTISSLRLVLRIIQTGQLTAAAAQLYMSQSGASHALRALEAQIGTGLFLRESEGLRLSEAGQKLLPYMETVLANVDAMRAEVAGLAGLGSGSLRVAAVPSLLASILPPVLREYGVRFPGVELSVFEGTDDEVRAWILSGMAHVGFAALPVDGVVAEEVACDEWLALAPEDDFPGKNSLTLPELARHRFLMSGGGCEQHIWRIFSRAGISMTEHLMVKQLPTIKAMVEAGLGVSLVPSLSVGELRGCRILRLKPRLYRRIGMFRAANSASTPALGAWMSLAKASLKTTSQHSRTLPNRSRPK
jgi:DNA-binding transcriptional LysR family regulator